MGLIHIRLGTIILSSLLSTISNAAICYNAAGVAWTLNSQYPIDPWVPCDPEAEVSACCSSGDYCMSNGLCMDSGSNNCLTQQGCTDSGWSTPCNNYCSGPSSKS